jgi:hypothetical protein
MYLSASKTFTILRTSASPTHPVGSIGRLIPCGAVMKDDMSVSSNIYKYMAMCLLSTVICSTCVFMTIATRYTDGSSSIQS